MGDSLLRPLVKHDKDRVVEDDSFDLHYIYATELTIMKLGTDTEPPFSKLKLWRLHDEPEPSRYEVQVNRYGVITKGKF